MTKATVEITDTVTKHYFGNLPMFANCFAEEVQEIAMDFVSSDTYKQERIGVSIDTAYTTEGSDLKNKLILVDAYLSPRTLFVTSGRIKSSSEAVIKSFNENADLREHGTNVKVVFGDALVSFDKESNKIRVRWAGDVQNTEPTKKVLAELRG